MRLLIINVVNWALWLINLLILARVIISWFPVSRDNEIVRILYQITEPILAPIRSLLQRSSFSRNLMFDLSPIIAFLLIGVLRDIIFRFILFF
jgi:YggT family protein